jgi:hypothetical protein
MIGPAATLRARRTPWLALLVPVLAAACAAPRAEPAAAAARPASVRRRPAPLRSPPPPPRRPRPPPTRWSPSRTAQSLACARATRQTAARRASTCRPVAKARRSSSPARRRTPRRTPLSLPRSPRAAQRGATTSWCCRTRARRTDLGTGKQLGVEPAHNARPLVGAEHAGAARHAAPRAAAAGRLLPGAHAGRLPLVGGRRRHRRIGRRTRCARTVTARRSCICVRRGHGVLAPAPPPPQRPWRTWCWGRSSPSTPRTQQQRRTRFYAGADAIDGCARPPGGSGRGAAVRCVARRRCR